MIIEIPDSLAEDAAAGRPIQVLGRRYVLDDSIAQIARDYCASYEDMVDSHDLGEVMRLHDALLARCRAERER